jgi:thioredoxin-dependent peroxiredoxin
MPVKMLKKGQPAPEILVNSVTDELISLKALKGKKVLIKFHRFSGCPVCQYQTHELIKQQHELNAAGIETILFMHSSKNKILANYNEVKGLHIISDKQKAFYRKYQSEFSWKKLFTFSTWQITMTAIFKGFFPQFDKFEGGITGVPSDFLLDENGNIKELNYGKHYGDSWSVLEVLNIANKP